MGGQISPFFGLKQLKKVKAEKGDIRADFVHPATLGTLSLCSENWHICFYKVIKSVQSSAFQMFLNHL
jgi:hypothetical protein